MGTTLSDAAGNYRTTVIVPLDATPGPHTIVVSGLDPAGRPRDDVTPLTAEGRTNALPFTGTNAMRLTLLGLLMITGGVLPLVAERRRHRLS